MAVEKRIEERLEELNRLREQGHLGGGLKRIEQQHLKGKLTARERLELLLDPGTFQELDPFVTSWAADTEPGSRGYLGDAVVTGFGKINGRSTYVYAQDFTVLGGSLSEAVAEKVNKVMDLAMKNGAPIIGLNDSGGARIQEGVVSLAGYGELFLRNTMASGVVPQISVILGPCAGGAVYSPAITDFVFMVQDLGQMYITGPDVIKAATGEVVSHETLGGAESHATMSGVAHFNSASEQECLSEVRRLLAFLPQNNMDDPPFIPPFDDPARTDDVLTHIVPDDLVKGYNMREVINRIVDDGDFMEVHAQFAQNIIVGFARMGGFSTGIVAQQPLYLAGVLDIDASTKAARFVRFCDSFNIPILTLVDVPGFLPGTEQEHRGIIRHGAKLIYAYAEATVPKITVLTRKDNGGAYLVMGSKHLGADINYAWPTAEIAVMGPEGAVGVLYKDELAAAENQEELRAQLVQEYRTRWANPYVAANRGYIDDVINPAETRVKVIKALEMLQNKRDTMPPKKHGNIPL
ncbi:MAG: acyl-CoA carboxylase subunit beta [Chloroflexi bacterium]|nr:acyl-CoA carboxylase subunit beta [Chloroflexota bacterium]